MLAVDLRVERMWQRGMEATAELGVERNQRLHFWPHNWTLTSPPSSQAIFIISYLLLWFCSAISCFSMSSRLLRIHLNKSHSMKGLLFLSTIFEEVLKSLGSVIFVFKGMYILFMISVSNTCCWFKLSVHERILKNILENIFEWFLKDLKTLKTRCWEFSFAITWIHFKILN